MLLSLMHDWRWVRVRLYSGVRNLLKYAYGRLEHESFQLLLLVQGPCTSEPGGRPFILFMAAVPFRRRRLDHEEAFDSRGILLDGLADSLVYMHIISLRLALT